MMQKSFFRHGLAIGLVTCLAFPGVAAPASPAQDATSNHLSNGQPGARTEFNITMLSVKLKNGGSLDIPALFKNTNSSSIPMASIAASMATVTANGQSSLDNVKAITQVLKTQADVIVQESLSFSVSNGIPKQIVVGDEQNKLDIKLISMARPGNGTALVAFDLKTVESLDSGLGKRISLNGNSGVHNMRFVQQAEISEGSTLILSSMESVSNAARSPTYFLVLMTPTIGENR